MFHVLTTGIFGPYEFGEAEGVLGGWDKLYHEDGIVDEEFHFESEARSEAGSDADSDAGSVHGSEAGSTVPE